MLHVLVSNQDHDMYKLSEKTLQENYEVLPLPDDSELLDYLKTTPVDLIILTISPTDKNSFRTFDILKRLPEIKRKPVIFLAKQTELILEKKAISLGASDFLTMPLTPQLLLYRVNICIELENLRKDRPYVEIYQDAISFSFAELVECRDVTTGGHLKNTTRYFNILLHEAMLSDKYKDVIPPGDVRDLLRSATLHDIGKLGISDKILRKASSLDNNEFEYMKTHTTLGKQAFEKIITETGGTKWLYLAKDMAYCHHERWDGTGYPNGLKGEEIPLYARMLAIVDVYDALTSNRAYKKAYSHQKATQIIVDGKGNYFDPYLVDLFVNVNNDFEKMLLINREALQQ